MSLDPYDIFFSILFGLIGIVYIRYGKKESSFYYMLSGLSLMAYTLVTTTTTQVICLGLLFMLLPFLLDRYL